MVARSVWLLTKIGSAPNSVTATLQVVHKYTTNCYQKVSQLAVENCKSLIVL